MLVEHLDNTGEVHERAGEAVDLVNHKHIDTSTSMRFALCPQEGSGVRVAPWCRRRDHHRHSGQPPYSHYRCRAPGDAGSRSISRKHARPTVLKSTSRTVFLDCSLDKLSAKAPALRTSDFWSAMFDPYDTSLWGRPSEAAHSPFGCDPAKE